MQGSSTIAPCMFNGQDWRLCHVRSTLTTSAFVVKARYGSRSTKTLSSRQAAFLLPCLRPCRRLRSLKHSQLTHGISQFKHLHDLLFRRPSLNQSIDDDYLMLDHVGSCAKSTGTAGEATNSCFREQPDATIPMNVPRFRT